MRISREELEAMLKERYELGLGVGYGLGCHYGQVERSNGLFIAYHAKHKVLEEAEQIVEDYGDKH